MTKCDFLLKNNSIFMFNHTGPRYTEILSKINYDYYVYPDLNSVYSYTPCRNSPALPLFPVCLLGFTVMKK